MGRQQVQRGEWKNGRMPEPQIEDGSNPPLASEPGKIHVDVFLRAAGVPLWHRAGKKAYAISKGKAFATDKEFVELFKHY